MTVHQWLAEWSSWGWPLLANHLWQATLISLVSFAAAGLLRKGSGRARYAVWLIASVRFVLPSALLVSLAQVLGIDFSSLLASGSGSSEGATVIFQLTAPINQIDESASTLAHPSRSHGELFCALTVVWLAGSVVLLALWLMRRRRFHSAMRAAPAVDSSRERQALERVRSWLQVKREVRLLMLRGTVEPGVWGVWRPIVFQPLGMAEELSEAEIEAVMMHEMTHVARWDNLIANLHRFLCCVLWFHPIVWILDRLLLAERERACDDEVLRLGGAPEVYATSLLKVLRFCLGWSVAGASNATGSNLGRRVERIMSKNVQVKLSVWQRVGIGSTAALVVILSMAAGLLTRERVGAQTRRPTEGVARGVPGGIPGGVPGGVPQGVPGGIPDGVPGGAPEFVVEGQGQLIERLAQAPETAIEFRNSANAPVVISEAKARAVPRDKDGPGDEFAVVPVVTLTNNTDRRIRGFTLEFRNGLERRAYYERAPSVVEPHGVHTSGRQNRFIILVGGPAAWSVRVGGVVFEDGEVWGVVPPPPPPPPPMAVTREALQQLEQAPDLQLQFEASREMPLSITAASARIVKGPGHYADGAEQYLMLPNIQLVNNTAKRIIGFGLDFVDGDSNRKTYVERVRISVEPFGSFTFRGFGRNDSFGTVGFAGNPDRIKALVVGVKFEDGEVWGSFRAPLPPPPPPAPPVLTSGPDDPKLIRKSGGVLADSATHRIVPESPPLARAARITGSVVVEVTVDEGGAVISARAISGHPLLKDAAVNAARQWQFKPATLSGVAVKVIGTLTFNFEP